MANTNKNNNVTSKKKPTIYNQYNNIDTPTEAGKETYVVYERIMEGNNAYVIPKETRNRYHEIQEAEEGRTVLEMLKKYEANGIVTSEDLALERQRKIATAQYGEQYLPENPIEAMNMLNKNKRNIELINNEIKLKKLQMKKEAEEALGQTELNKGEPNE